MTFLSQFRRVSGPILSYRLTFMIRLRSRSRWARRMPVNSKPNCRPSIQRTIAWSTRRGHLKSGRNKESFSIIPIFTSTDDSALHPLVDTSSTVASPSKSSSPKKNKRQERSILLPRRSCRVASFRLKSFGIFAVTEDRSFLRKSGRQSLVYS